VTSGECHLVRTADQPAGAGKYLHLCRGEQRGNVETRPRHACRPGGCRPSPGGGYLNVFRILAPGAKILHRYKVIWRIENTKPKKPKTATITALPRRGTILVREWQGTTHQVAVGDDGFLWNGRTYRSLSSIARAITGTNWNGPRFFGMREMNEKTPETRRDS
jgi:hypothetical protein